MGIEDGVALAHRPRNLLPNSLQLTGGLRRRASRAIIGSARS